MNWQYPGTRDVAPGEESLRTKLSYPPWPARASPQRLASVVNIKALRALAPRAYARPQAITAPPPPTPQPRWSRRHSAHWPPRAPTAPARLWAGDYARDHRCQAAKPPMRA